MVNKKVIHTLFEQQAEEYGTRIAITTENGAEHFTYTTVNTMANQLAHLLLNLRMTKGDVAAVLFPDPLLQVLALLGVFKAGSIYLAVDKKYRANHWDVLYNTTRPKVFLTSETELDILFEYDRQFEYSIPLVVTIARKGDSAFSFTKYEYNGSGYSKTEIDQAFPETNPEVEHHGDDPNYIFFTSGSTGKPKAVLGCHKSLSHFIHWECRELQIYNGDRIAMLPSFSFDASLQAIFMALINGAVLCLVSADTKADLSGLQAWLREQRVSVIHLVPTLFRLLSTDWNDDYISPGSIYPDLRYVLSAGEKLYNKDILNWREVHGENTEVINFYGTTEATILSTFYRIKLLEGAPADVLSVGQPISNTVIMILNADGQLCRVNEVGSIYIRTPFLSKGYYNDPGHTAEKFVQNPLSQTRELVYKTGDYGKYASDRSILVVGREDGLVKLNGVRIDINTIESTLLRLEELTMVKCIYHQDEQMNATLVCFYKPASVAVEDLRQHCSRYLSQYETPSLFIGLEHFPINANGKVDPVILQQKIQSALSERSYAAPRTELEAKLATIWCDVLHLEKVGIKDNFYLLGGNSIKLIRLKLRIHRELGAELGIQDLFSKPILEEQALLISRTQVTEYLDIVPVEDNGDYAASSAQYRLWLLAQFDDGARAYHMPYAITLDGAYDISSFIKAVEATVDRHEILRTVFTFSEDKGLRQVVNPVGQSGFVVAYHDFRQDPIPEERAAAYMQEDNDKSFDLDKGPLIRAAVLRVANDSYVFYYNLHHIVGDGWSLEVLARDVMAFYKGFCQGVKPELPKLKIQYKDYAAWQLKQLELPRLEAARKFWIDRFSSDIPALDLPVQRTRPKIKTHNGRAMGGYLPSRLLQRLNTLCEQEGGSLFTGLLAIWSILLYRYTKQKNIVIGSPVAGRDHIALEDQIGFYVNTLALGNQIEPEQRFIDCYSQVKERAYAAYEHQMYPFDVLMEELSLIRDTGRSPLFDCMLTLQNMADRKRSFSLSNFSAPDAILDLGVCIAKFDLELFFEETEEALLFSVHYNTDLFDSAFIEELTRSFRQVTEFVLDNPEEEVRRIPILSNKQREQLLRYASGEQIDYPAETVIDKFKRQAAETPGYIAVLLQDTELTYQELDTLSDKVAGRLVHFFGIDPGDFIGLQLADSIWLPVAILGILKSGAAYVPIDERLPESRRAFMIGDTGLSLLITSTDVALDETSINCGIWQFGPDMEDILQDEWPAPYPVSPDLPAYVIYTSGSTGLPKGVLVGHAALNHYLNWSGALYLNTGLSNTDFGLYTSLSFDLTITSLFLPLISGGTLKLYHTARPVTEVLQDYLNDSAACIKLTPAHINLIGELEMSAESLEVAIVGGEELTKRHIDILRKMNPDIRIYNEYGPTEATVGCVVHEVTTELAAATVRIGRPMANTSVFVCDEYMNLQPAGVPGELYIGGTTLAVGYIGRPELTSEKFVSSPFETCPRLYRTGDLAYWTPEGELVFKGRMDSQVKLQGYRIEPGEIEYFLLRKAEVKEAVVLVSENGASEKELKAYFTAGEQQTVPALREHLLRYIPEYAVPVRFVQLERMPLTMNGKTDRKALLTIQDNLIKTGLDIELPKNEEEKLILDIWTDVLGNAAIGTKDDFFSLGGNSIKAVRILHRVNREFGTEINMSSLFSYPTIEYLASQVVIIRQQQRLRKTAGSLKEIEL